MGVKNVYSVILVAASGKVKIPSFGKQSRCLELLRSIRDSTASEAAKNEITDAVRQLELKPRYFYRQFSQTTTAQTNLISVCKGQLNEHGSNPGTVD